MRSVKRAGKKVQVERKATLTPPPWHLLDAALLEIWREAEEALRAWMEIGTSEVSEQLLATCGGDEDKARRAQAVAGALAWRAQWYNASALFDGLNNGSLAVGHRTVRKMVEGLIDDVDSHPQMDDPLDDPNGRVAKFAKRAFDFQRKVRTVLRADAVGKKKERDCFLRMVNPPNDNKTVDNQETVGAQ